MQAALGPGGQERPLLNEKGELGTCPALANPEKLIWLLEKDRAWVRATWAIALGMGLAAP